MDQQLTTQPNTHTAILNFTPPPDTISEILNQLSDPDTLLSDIADNYKTTLEALTLWMARDDIMQRIAALQSAIAARVRLMATAALPKATEALRLMICEYTHEANYVPTNHGSLKAIQTRHRARDLTRKSAALLYRLTKFQSVTPDAVPPDVRSSGQPVRAASRSQAPAVGEAPTSGGTDHHNTARHEPLTLDSLLTQLHHYLSPPSPDPLTARNGRASLAHPP